jgi:hypothetical protein
MQDVQNEKIYNVEADILSIPIYIFHGEVSPIEDNLNYVSDENDIITLITPEEEAKQILYNLATPTKEYQEVANRMMHEDAQEHKTIIQVKNDEKNYVKDGRYNLSFVFLGQDEETGNLSFRIIQDTITGDFNKTREIISQSVLRVEE